MEAKFFGAASADDWISFVEAFNDNLLLALDHIEIMRTECALVGDQAADQFLASIRAAVAEFARVHFQNIGAHHDPEARISLL